MTGKLPLYRMVIFAFECLHLVCKLFIKFLKIFDQDDKLCMDRPPPGHDLIMNSWTKKYYLKSKTFPYVIIVFAFIRASCESGIL